MANRLHQINMEYRAEEDRVMLKINTTDRKELRLALTRRFVRQFWDSLQKILAEQPVPASVPATAPERKAMVGFRAERAAPESSFREKFEGGTEFPLGADPVLSFWLAYILTRPLGASLGDYLSQAQKYGGLGLGTIYTSITFLVVIAALVTWLTAVLARDKPTAANLPQA